MQRTGLLGALVALALGALAPSHAAFAQSDDVATRVQALERELALLKRKLEVKDEAEAARGPQPVIGAGSDGFFLRSPDAKYQFRLRGYTHFDGRFFSESSPFTGTAAGRGAETFAFRRIRPQFEGTLGGVVDFRIMPDFAGSTLVVQDAYANVRYLPEFQVQFGKFKGPVGLERLQSATAMPFIERGFPTLFAPNRDVGVMVQGIFKEGLASYQLAWTNGVNDTGSADTDGDDDKDLTGRFFIHPFQQVAIEPLQGFGIGLAGSYGRQRGAPPTFRTTGQQQFITYATGVVQTGERVRYYPQGYWYYGPFGLLAEYAVSSGELRNAAGTTKVRADNSAWQLVAGWVLTGENASYRGVIPTTNFDPFGGTFGAFELVTRYGAVHFDDVAHRAGFITAASPEHAKAWAIGANWYLNRNLKFAVNYERTTFQAFSSAAADRDTEGVVVGRVQLAY